MKQILESIEVQPAHSPQSLRWRGQTFSVEQILESWSWRGRWWLDPQLQGERRRYYRLMCQPAGRRSPRLLEIFQRTQNGSRHWILSRLVD